MAKQVRCVMPRLLVSNLHFILFFSWKSFYASPIRPHQAIPVFIFHPVFYLAANV